MDEEDILPNQYKNIMTLFSTSRYTLKNPRITIEPRRGLPVVFSFWINNKGNEVVSIYSRSGDYRVEYGQIHNGNWYKKGNPDKRVINLVNTLNTNPGKVIREASNIEDKCCFCRKDLTDGQSTKVGFGKTCAENWGLKDIWLR